MSIEEIESKLERIDLSKEDDSLSDYYKLITNEINKITHHAQKHYQHENTLFGNDGHKHDLEIAFRIRQLQMKEGEIAQKILGSFLGWEDLGVGHTSGLDIRKQDNSCIMEIKNKWNTCNSGSQKAVLDKLADYKRNNPNTVCVWGIVNPKPNSKTFKETIIHNGLEIIKLQGYQLFSYVMTIDGVDHSRHVIAYVQNLLYPPKPTRS